MAAKEAGESHIKVKGWAATESSGTLSPFIFSRRANGADDITIKIKYCGVCHTDLHFARNDWGNTMYPIVPGHEITGIVTEVGTNVKKFVVGDRAAVGCLAGSCESCDECKDGLENYCQKLILVYNNIYHDGAPTYGGYSNLMVINQRYALKFPENLPMDAGAPLLCAGISVYSPMKYYGMTNPGKRLGVVGLGGLGHIAVKMGKAFGLHVTVISTSTSKMKEATELLGADSFINSKDPKQMLDASKSLHYILDTVSANHPLDPLLGLLKFSGKLVMVGAPTKPIEMSIFSLLHDRRMVGGSLIGGIAETQEMLDFCGEHNITAEIEKIPIEYINTAMDRLSKSDVKYRFVIDMERHSQLSTL